MLLSGRSAESAGPPAPWQAVEPMADAIAGMPPRESPGGKPAGADPGRAKPAGPGSVPVLASTGGAGHKAVLSPLTVLIVDDDPFMRSLIRILLRLFDVAAILDAGDVPTGLDMLAVNPVDVVLLDIEMPGADGLEFLRAVRLDPANPKQFTPIIVLSSHNERAMIERARDSGASGYVVKPLTPAVVAARIAEVVQRPRDFILSAGYRGPDRRRERRAGADRAGPGGMERRASAEERAAFRLSPEEARDIADRLAAEYAGRRCAPACPHSPAAEAGPDERPSPPNSAPPTSAPHTGQDSGE